MNDPGDSRQARGRRAEALSKAVAGIGADIAAILAGRGSARTLERLTHTIDGDFVPRLREFIEEFSRKDESSAAIDSLQNLIDFCDGLPDRARTNALEQSDRQTLLELWWPFQREAALWSDIKRLRDPTTGKIRPEFATEEDRQRDDFREASLIFFENAGTNDGKGPTMRELYESLRENEATKHITWQELTEAPHYGPLRKLTHVADKR